MMLIVLGVLAVIYLIGIPVLASYIGKGDENKWSDALKWPLWVLFVLFAKIFGITGD
jgi:Na+-driven multidrug efflux pump